MTRALGIGDRARMLRIATDAATAGRRTATIRRLEDELRRAGAAVEAVIPFSELRTAIGDHLRHEARRCAKKVRISSRAAIVG